MEEDNITVDVIKKISDHAVSINEKLLDMGQHSTNYAFNIGIYIGLIPTLGITIGVFLATKGSWAATGIVAAILGIAMIAFANLAAFQAGSNTVQRIYLDQLFPQTEQFLNETHIDRSTYERIAFEHLPVGSPLTKYFTNQLPYDEPKPSGFE